MVQYGIEEHRFVIIQALAHKNDQVYVIPRVIYVFSCQYIGIESGLRPNPALEVFRVRRSIP